VTTDTQGAGFPSIANGASSSPAGSPAPVVRLCQLDSCRAPIPSTRRADLKWCSTQCRERSRKRQRNRTTLAAKPCAFCERTFQPRRANAKFCCAACQRKESAQRLGTRPEKTAPKRLKYKKVDLVDELRPCANPLCSVRHNRADDYHDDVCRKQAEQIERGEEPERRTYRSKIGRHQLPAAMSQHERDVRQALREEQEANLAALLKIKL
jgi:hypothetical protein